MSLPTSKIVNISVSTTPTFLNPAGFGTFCIITPSTTFPSGNRKQTFSGGAAAALLSIGLACGTNSEEYKAAEEFLSGDPNPGSVQIARRFAAATPGELLGSISATKVIATWAAISTGSLKLNIDATVETITAIDFTGVTTMAGVAAILQAAIAEEKAGFTVVWNGQQFILRSGTTGAASAVGFPVAPGSGIDLGHMIGGYQADGGISTVGVVAETITATLQALSLLANPFYGFGFTAEVTVQNLLDAAAWGHINKRPLGYNTADPNCLNINDETNIGYQFQQLEYDYCFGQYDPTNPYSAFSGMANMLSIDFTQPNSVHSLMFNDEPGVLPLPASFTTDESDALDSFNLNYYATFGNVNIIENGIMASGMYFDTRIGLDWYSNKIQVDLFNWRLSLRLNSVGMTDAQVKAALQVVDKSNEAAVYNGLIAPEVWNGETTGDGQYKTGDTLPKGYYSYAPSVSTLTPQQKQSRIAPTISIIACGAGQIQGFNVALNFQQ